MTLCSVGNRYYLDGVTVDYEAFANAMCDDYEEAGECFHSRSPNDLGTFDFHRIDPATVNAEAQKAS